MKKTIITLLLFILGILSHYTLHAQQQINLQKAIDLALSNNPGITAAANKVKIADAKNMQAKSSFYPKANILSKYLYTNNMPGMYPLLGVSVPVMNSGAPTGDNITMHPMAPYMNLDRDLLTFDLNVVYPIYVGNKRKNAVESTEILHQVYEINKAETSAQLVEKVKTAFYNYLTINDVINVYEKALTQLNNHLALAKKAYEVGLRSEYDVLNFQSKIAGFESKIVEFKGKRTVVVTALKSLLNIPEDSKVTFVGTIDRFYSNIYLKKQLALSTIQSNNLKIQTLDGMKKLLNHKEKMEGAAQLPIAFAFGNYHIYHGKDFPPFDKTWRNGYAVGFGVKINLFDGNMTKGKVEEIKAQSAIINNYKEGMKLKLRFEYQKCLENITYLEAKMESENKNMALGQKAYSIAQVGYKNGVITNIELNDAQLNITKIETSIINIKKGLLIQHAILEYLNGQQQ